MYCFFLSYGLLRCFCCFIGVTPLLLGADSNTTSPHKFGSTCTPRWEYKDNACQKDDSQNDLLLPTHLMTLVGFLRLRGKCYLIMSLAAVLSFSMLVNGHINSSDILLIFNCSAPSYQKFHCNFLQHVILI
jgi:hypothetical protein